MGQESVLTLSMLPVTTFPSGRHFRVHVWSMCRPSVCTHFPVVISHTRMVPSVPADIALLPSSVTATVRTALVWPWSHSEHLPVFTSHIPTWVGVGQAIVYIQLMFV